MIKYWCFYFSSFHVLTTGSAPLEAREFEASWSCQDMHVDVRSRRSISLALREMEAFFKWVTQAPLLMDTAWPLKKTKQLTTLFSAFDFEHFAEMLNINAVFQTVVSFPGFVSSHAFLSMHLPRRSASQRGRYIKSPRMKISAEPLRFIYWIKCLSHFRGSSGKTLSG